MVQYIIRIFIYLMACIELMMIRWARRLAEDGGSGDGDGGGVVVVAGGTSLGYCL